MIIRKFALLFLAAQCFSTAAAQESTAPAAPYPASGQLRLETLSVPGEIGRVFASPLKCDAKGNLYERTQPDGPPGLRKLSPKGEQLAVFQPASPDLKIDRAAYFSLAPNDDVYQLIIAREPSRYVFVYGPHGTVKSRIKLRPGFFFAPAQVAVFPSGELLVTGMERDSDHDNPTVWPYQAIFSSSGAMLKELHFEDDDKLHDMAVDGDKQIVSPTNRSTNLAIVGGSAELGADSNVYVMRRVTPAIFYAVSANGSVRRLTVDPGRPDFLDPDMHVSGNRIAVLFRNQQTHEELIKVVDLQGKEVAVFESPMVNGWSAIGPAFICYASNPDRFTFLTTLDDDKLEIIRATPR